jgi:hypothetical protein
MVRRTNLRIPAPEQWLLESAISGTSRQDDRTLCHMDRLVETLSRDLHPGVRTLTALVLLFTIDRWLAAHEPVTRAERHRAAAVWRLYEAAAEEVHERCPAALPLLVAPI